MPALVGESAESAAIVNAVEENGACYYKAINGKPLFRALYDTYIATLNELKAMLQVSILGSQTNSPKATGQLTA